MSKRKKRRPNIPQVTLRRFGSTQGSEDARAAGTEQGFSPDYSYVLKDLRRIGVLAASFVLLLLALSFVLT